MADKYEHREFPKMVYDHANCEPAQLIKKGIHEIHVDAVLAHKIVNDQAELDAALEAGFSLKPPVHEVKAEVAQEEVLHTPSAEVQKQYKRGMFGKKQ